MSSVGITKPGAAPKTYPAPSNPAGQPVFLDSGGTLSRLPTTLFNAILADFPTATADPAGSGIYEVPCSVAAEDGTMDFGFGNTVVHVPFHEFIWQAGTNLCALGVVADDSSFVLGDSFLRAAYGKNILMHDGFRRGKLTIGSCLRPRQPEPARRQCSRLWYKPCSYLQRCRCRPFYHRRLRWLLNFVFIFVFIFHYPNNNSFLLHLIEAHGLDFV
jgi:hypothetical protein